MTSFEMPEEIEGGGFLDKPGRYHLLCTNADPEPTDKNESLMDAFRFRLTVLDGTEPSQKGRTCDITLFKGNMSHKDGGKFSWLRIARMARALKLHDTNSGKLVDECRGQKVDINWAEAAGRQCVISLVPGNDPKFFEVDGTHIYGVDDDEAMDVPKKQDVLKQMSGKLFAPAKSSTEAAMSDGDWGGLEDDSIPF